MKILPIGYPDITAYPHHAHLYAIMNGIDKYENYKLPWLSNNYVQLEFEADNLDFSIGFDILPLLENCPWLIKDSISYEMISEKWDNIIDFLIDAINIDYYIYIEVDEFHIKEYDNYQKEHLSHTILIYGYDDITKEFYVADFFKNRKYYFAKVAFEEIKKGYENMPTTFLLGVFLLRKKDNSYFTYEFNRSGLIKNLEDFLYSQNTKERNMIINYTRVMPHVKESVFGLNVFDSICYSFSQTGYVPLTNLYVIKEHIKVLEIIVLQLSELGLVENWENIYFGLQGIYKKSELCVNSYVKYHISNNKQLITRIIDLIQEIKIIEEKLVKKIITNLRVEENYNAFNNMYFHATQVGLRLFNTTFDRDVFKTIDDTSYLQVTFWGIGIIYAADKGNSYGKCDVYLDGEKYGVVSLKSENVHEIQEVLYINNLSNTFHTIRFRSADKGIINFKYLKNIKNDSELSNLQDVSLKFVEVDKETMGNWKGKYGEYGYVIPGSEWNYPIYGDIAIQKLNLYVNSEINVSNSLLQSPLNCERVNRCYYCEKQEVVNVIVTGKKKRKITLYLLDWTPFDEIKCSVTVRSLNTKEELDFRTIENMKNGVYITYEVLGACEFIIQYNDLKQNRAYGDFYGLFFD